MIEGVKLARGQGGVLSELNVTSLHDMNHSVLWSLVVLLARGDFPEQCRHVA